MGDHEGGWPRTGAAHNPCHIKHTSLDIRPIVQQPKYLTALFLLPDVGDARPGINFILPIFQTPNLPTAPHPPPPCPDGGDARPGINFIANSGGIAIEQDYSCTSTVNYCRSAGGGGMKGRCNARSSRTTPVGWGRRCMC